MQFPNNLQAFGSYLFNLIAVTVKPAIGAVMKNKVLKNPIIINYAINPDQQIFLTNLSQQQYLNENQTIQDDFDYIKQLRKIFQMQAYNSFIERLSMRPDQFNRHISNCGLDVASYYHTLPAQVYNFLWMPLIQAKGFYSALPYILKNLRTILTQGLSEQKRELQYYHILYKICPAIILYKSHKNPPQQTIKRIETLKEEFKLTKDICCPIVDHYQSKRQKQNKNYNIEEELISQILKIFNTTEKKLDYQGYFLQVLNKSVGQSIFYIINNQMSFEQVYDHLLTKNKEQIIYLFYKIKERYMAYGKILQVITTYQNNKTLVEKIKNIQHWDKLKESQQKPKSSMIMEIIAQAIHRLLFLIYDDASCLVNVFLCFLKCCKFSFHAEMKSAIGYHLLALHKIHKYQQNQKVYKMIEDIWKQKLKGIKINENYLQNQVKFVTISQKTQQRTLQALQINSNKQSLSDKSASKVSRTAKLKVFNKKVKNIEDELKRFHLQKILLLIEPLSSYITLEYQINSKVQCSSIIQLIVLIIKRIQQKIQYSYGYDIIIKIIYMQLKQLIQKYISGYQIKNGCFQSLSLYQLCPLDQQYINFQYLLKFHQLYNFQESLQTLLNLKMLRNQLNRDLLNSIDMQQIQNDLKDKKLEKKVFQLFKMQFQEKKIDHKKLSLIGKLLTLDSSHILNNLIVNYVYYLFKSQKYNDSSSKTKLDCLTQLINESIELKDQKRIEFFLVMGEILNQVQNKMPDILLRKQKGNGVSNIYFSFLKRQKHIPYYYAYSQYYNKFNYLKQSLYFLELHQFNQHNQHPTQQVVSKAISLYERLDISFKNNLKFIQCQFNIQNNKGDILRHEQKKYKNHDIIQQLLVCILNQIRSNNDLIRRLNFYNDAGAVELWFNIYHRFISVFIKQISILKQNEEIYDNLVLLSLLIKFISLRIHFVKDPKYNLDHLYFFSLVKQIQSLKDQNNQFTFIKYFMAILQNEQYYQKLQAIYLDKLLQKKQLAELYKYLRQDLKEFQSNTKLSNHYLVYIIKYYHQKKDFLHCLATIKSLQQRKFAKYNKAQIFQLQLESRYKSMLNFTINDYMNFLKENCINYIDLQAQSRQSRQQMIDKHFNHYFKMFRMLFNRYNFMLDVHNDNFLCIYFKFIEKSQIIVKNKKFLNESIFYLLRFIAQKFYYPPQIKNNYTYAKSILTIFKGQTSHFVPFCNYLIKRISVNENKNGVIKDLLIQILSQNSKECIWIISLLKNFTRQGQKPKNWNILEKISQQVIQQIYQKVQYNLQKSKKINWPQLKYIDALRCLALCKQDQINAMIAQFKSLAIPHQFPFIFNSNCYISKIIDARKLSNGKSFPVEITFMLVYIHEKQRQFIKQKIIMKATEKCGSNYWMQSNAANFFEETRIIDHDITYKIQHLSKNVMALEYVDNIGTLNNIMVKKYNKEFKKVDSMYNFFKDKRNNQSQKRLLQIYDQIIQKKANLIPLSKIIYDQATNIRQWWIKVNNFIRTQAQWSYLGYIVGLGDRHIDNIMLNSQLKIFHIDFQYCLDTGLKLPFPQYAPFRLTGCCIQPLGILGCYGLFYAKMVQSAIQFDKKQRQIWRALSHFIGSTQTNIGQQIVSRSKFNFMEVKCIQYGIVKLIETGKQNQLLRMMYSGWRAHI